MTNPSQAPAGSALPEEVLEKFWQIAFAQTGHCASRYGRQNCETCRKVVDDLAAAYALGQSSRQCVCTVDDGLVQEWVSKAREVAKAKGFTLPPLPAPPASAAPRTEEDPRCTLCGDPKSRHTKSEADWRTVPGCTGSYRAGTEGERT